MRLLVEAKAELATSALDIPNEVIRVMQSAAVGDPASSWYVSFAPIPTDQIQCILYHDGRDVHRFRSATYEDKKLSFVPWSA